jgi:hypothetical protein
MLQLDKERQRVILNNYMNKLVIQRRVDVGMLGQYRV